jgi:hypothetical protein
MSLCTLIVLMKPTGHSFHSQSTVTSILSKTFVITLKRNIRSRYFNIQNKMLTLYGFNIFLSSPDSFSLSTVSASWKEKMSTIEWKKNEESGFFNHERVN